MIKIIEYLKFWGKDRFFSKPLLIYSKPIMTGYACLGWDLKPHIEWSDGTYYPSKIEKEFYKEYFIDGNDWPINPITKKKLLIRSNKKWVLSKE